ARNSRWISCTTASACASSSSRTGLGERPFPPTDAWRAAVSFVAGFVGGSVPACPLSPLWGARPFGAIAYCAVPLVPYMGVPSALDMLDALADDTDAPVDDGRALLCGRPPAGAPECACVPPRLAAFAWRSAPPSVNRARTGLPSTCSSAHSTTSRAFC